MAHESSPIPIPLMIPKGLSTSFIFYDKEESESITDNEIKWLVKEVER